MPIVRPQFVNGEIYHIVTRGVEKRLIFEDKSDYYRGIFSLFEFNDDKHVIMRDRRRSRLYHKQLGQEQFSAIRNLIVEILAFCLMPNHIHLLLRQLKDNGISKFMSKFGAGYATYFNKKHSRTGHLFQGRFRAIRIQNNDQLKNAFVYVHTNPTGIIEPGWKEQGVKNPEEIIRFLENYKWSSYLDYIGKKNFPSVTNREFLTRVMGGTDNCKNFVNSWIRYKGKIKTLGNVVLE
jgi:putative transposase